MPTLYVLSSVLFAALGVLMQCWARRQHEKGSSYYQFTDEGMSNEDRSIAASSRESASPDKIHENS